MALLDKTTLQKSAGLLNATAPEDHFLAYITEGERDMLVRAGGKETSTVSGINAYPPPTGTAAEARAYSGGSTSGSGPAGGASAGGDYGGNVNPAQTYGAGDISPGLETNIDRTIPYDDDYDATWTDIPTKETKESLLTKFKKGVVSNKYVANVVSKMGWITDNALIRGLGGALTLLANLGPEAQAKAMTWSLNRKLKNIQNKKDFHPGAYGYKISDIQDDLEGIKDGTFTQDMYTAKYGSGDTTNPLDASYVHRPGGDNERALTNIITPYAAHAIGGTTQQPSVAAQWYANLGGSSGGFNLTTAYADAKSKVAQTLGSPSAVGQLAVNQSPFYNWLKENSLNKGIL